MADWLDEVVGEESAQTEEVQEEAIQEETVNEAEQAVEEIKEEAQETEEPKEEKEPEKTAVPLPFMMREREKRQIAEAERDTYKEKYEQDINTLKEQIMELRSQAKQPEAPNPDDDPVAYLQHTQEQKLNEVNSKFSELQAKLDEKDQTSQQTEQINQLKTYLGQYEDSFKAQTPDYYDALNHMRQKQVQYLQTKGYDQNSAAQYILNQEFEKAVQLMGVGYNPAQLIYEEAKRDYGYTPPSKDEPAANPKAEELKNLDENLGDSGKSGGGASVKDLITMSDEEFDEAWNSSYGSAKW